MYCNSLPNFPYLMKWGALLKNCLEKVTAILSGLGAAIAVPASAATASGVATTAAVGLPLLATLGTGALLYSAIKDRKKDDCTALLDDARNRVMDAWPYDDPTDRTEQAERDRLENALADVLPKCLPADETALRALLATEGLNGEKIAHALFTDAPTHDSTFEEPGAKMFFLNVVQTAWDALRQEPTFYATLQSFVDEKMFVELADIRHAIDEGFGENQRQLSDIQQTVDQLVAAERDRSREFGIKEGMLIALARRYAEGSPADFDAALAGLERALETARDELERGRLPSNISDAVDAVIARIDALNETGDLEGGQAALEAELAAMQEEDARRNAARSRLFDKGISQAILTRSVELACRYTVEKFNLDAPADPKQRDDAFFDIFTEWYHRGRHKGLNFDLEVAIALARERVTQAQTNDQRGRAQMNLGTALRSLGERESGTERLEEAVTAYREALKERTRDRVPLEWATTQVYLGVALLSLGNQTRNRDQIDDSIAAFEAARAVFDEANHQPALDMIDPILAEARAFRDQLDDDT